MSYTVPSFEIPGLSEHAERLITFLANAEAIPLLSVLAKEIEVAGQGVYAIFYKGSAELYNCHPSLFDNWPVYIGKAEAGGGRKGTTGSLKSLKQRLCQHAQSIKAAGFDLNDFVCKPISLESISDFISGMEKALIRHHKPVWNSSLDGFGNHAQGEGRTGQAMASWDVMHPGRPQAQGLKVVDGALEALELKVFKHCAEYRQSLPPTRVSEYRQIVRKF